MNLPLGTHYMIFYEYSNIVASHVFFAPDPNRQIIQVESSWLFFDRQIFQMGWKPPVTAMETDLLTPLRILSLFSCIFEECFLRYVCQLTGSSKIRGAKKMEKKSISISDFAVPVLWESIFESIWIYRTWNEGWRIWIPVSARLSFLKKTVRGRRVNWIAGHWASALLFVAMWSSCWAVKLLFQLFQHVWERALRERLEKLHFQRLSCSNLIP